MSIQIIKKADQARGNFNNGAILEHKPIGFPQDGGNIHPYSTLFYWAYAWTTNGESVIELHPHKGFEIISIVLNGNIEHYDTKLMEWIRLEAGSAQVIRSGNGISHSEKISADGAIFQIWLNPDLSKSLNKPAAYNDYAHSEFNIKKENGMTKKVFCGHNATMKLDTDGVKMEEITFMADNYELPMHLDTIYSVFLIEGSLNLDDKTVEEGDFLIIQEQDKINITVDDHCKVFIILSPLQPGYVTYAEGNS